MITGVRSLRRLRGFAVAFALATSLALLLVASPGASAATITVNDTGDTPANDGDCILQEAIVSANTDATSGVAAGECAAGSGADTINFSAVPFDGTLASSTISESTLSITQPVTINGASAGCVPQPKPCVGLDLAAQSGFAVNASNVTISGIAIYDASCVSCRAIQDDDSVTGMVVRNTWMGINLNQVAEQNQNGIIVTGNNAVIGGTTANDRNVLARTVNAAVRIVGAANTRVQGNYFGTRPDGITITGMGNADGIEAVGDTASSAPPPVGTLVGGPEVGVPGTCEAPCNVFGASTVAAIDLEGGGGTTIPAGQTAIEGNFLGLSAAAGTFITSTGINVGNADDVTVGGDPTRRNYITTDVNALGGAGNLDIVSNFVGLNPAGSAPVGDGTIKLAQGGPPAITGATVAGNRIAASSGAPIEARTNNSVFQGNVIGIGTGNQNVGGGVIGISMQLGGSGNQVGGSGAGEGNVVGNAAIGILINETGTTIAGNFVGTNATESTAHAITGPGINLTGGGNNFVGGTTAGGENVISNAAGGAIRVETDGNDGNRILRNRGTVNAGNPFIDLRPGIGAGVSPTAANNAIPAPVITGTPTAGSVSGTSLPNSTIRVYGTTDAAGASPVNVRNFVGQTTANGAGAWTLTCPGAGCDQQAQGADKFAATQMDGSGNTSELSNAASYTDLPPDTFITTGPAEGSTTSDSTPTFGFTSESGATFECSIDGGSFTGCSGPGNTHTPFTTLSDGQHTFAVRATDNPVTGTDPTPATRTFTVDTSVPPPPPDDGGGSADTAAPDTSITGGPKKKEKKGKASFSFTSSEAGSIFECSLDGGPFEPCTSPKDVKVKKGKHTFAVRAKDAAGNVDATPATQSWKVKKKK